MVTSNEIKTAKISELYKFLDEASTNKEIYFVLSSLGKLPDSFDGEKLLGYLKNNNADIRYLTVKNLGKLSNEEFASVLFNLAKTDPDSLVRREAVSSLGRMRIKKHIPMYIELLDNPDPKIIMQAMRALLVFKGERDVDDALFNLRQHSNEQIQRVLDKEYNGNHQITDFGTHIQSPDYLKNTVIHGDVSDVLEYIPNGSVHLTFTSPPYYNARDYSLYNSYVGYLDLLENIFSKVHRITKEGRFLIVNTSPVIIPRISRSYSSRRYAIPYDLHARLIGMGWDFIDNIIWVKPESSVKNRNGSFSQHRKPLGYKTNPITEHLMVYRKETNRLIDWNMSQYEDKIIEESKVTGDFETTNIWQISPTHDKLHSATFPEELCNRIIRYYSYKGDLVFDPFAGSGTLGLAASNLNRYFFMTELENVYFEEIRRKLSDISLGERAPCFLTLEKFKQKIIEN